MPSVASVNDFSTRESPTHRSTIMTSTAVRPARNGVDVPTLFATLDAVKGQPEIAAFQFRATNEWISGTHNRSTIQGFYGAGQEDQSRPIPFTYDADHPTVLVGNNNGPTPVEFLLHAIAACLTSGLANIASARGVTAAPGPVDRRRATSTCSASSALSDTVRNGYRQIRVSFEIEGDASAEMLAALVEQSRRRSAVYDVLVNGTDVADRRDHQPDRRPELVTRRKGDRHDQLGCRRRRRAGGRAPPRRDAARPGRPASALRRPAPRYGSDTLSTHALMRGGVLQLQRWGLLGAVAASGTPAIAPDGLPLRRGQGRRLDQAGRRGRCAVRPAPHRARRAAGRCRAARPARASSSPLRSSDSLRDRRRPGHPGWWCRIGAAAPPGSSGPRLVVGADGRDSLVAAAVRAPIEVSGRHAGAYFYGYWADLPTDGYEWFYSPRGDRRPDPDQRRPHLPVRRRGPGAAARGCEGLTPARPSPGWPGRLGLTDRLARGHPGRLRSATSRTAARLSPAGVRSRAGPWSATPATGSTR